MAKMERVVILSKKELKMFLDKGWRIEEILNYYTEGKYEGKVKYRISREIMDSDIDNKRISEKKIESDTNKKAIKILVTPHARKRIYQRLNLKRYSQQNSFILDAIQKGDIVIKKEKRTRIINLLYEGIVFIIVKINDNSYVIITVVGEVPFRLQQRLRTKWGLRFVDNFFARNKIIII